MGLDLVRCGLHGCGSSLLYCLAASELVASTVSTPIQPVAQDWIVLAECFDQRNNVIPARYLSEAGLRRLLTPC